MTLPMNPQAPQSDPVLLDAAQRMAAARARATAAGETITDADADAYMRQRTQGRYGYADAARVLGLTSGATVGPTDRVPPPTSAPTTTTAGAPPIETLTGDALTYRIARHLMEAKAKALRAGVPITPADEAAYVAEKSNGRVSLADVNKAIGANPGNVSLANLIRAGESGALLGFNDELAGKIHGGQAETERIRLAQAAFQRAHPFVSLASQVAGGLAIPGVGEVKLLKAIPALKAAAEAAPLATAIGEGVFTGGTLGAIGGAGNADEGQRLKGAATSGAAGAVLGAAAPAVAAPVVNVARRLLGQPAPLNAGERAVRSAIDQTPGGMDAVLDAARRLTTAGRGDAATLADLSPQLGSLATSAAKSSDPVQQAIATLRTMRQGQGARLVADALEGIGDNPVASRQLATLRSARQQFADAAYGAMREANPSMGIFLDKQGVASPYGDQASTALAELLNRPVVRKAVERAVQTGEIAGLDEQGAIGFRALHDVRRALDSQASTAFRAGNGSLGKALAGARDELDAAIGEQVPQYAATQAEYARRKALEKALQSGTKAISAKDATTITDALSSLSPDEAAQYRYGLASSVLTKLRAMQSDPKMASKLQRAAPALEAKLRAAFPSEDAFRAFMAKVDAEHTLAQLQAPPGAATVSSASGLLPSRMDLLHGGFYTLLHHPLFGAAYAAGRPLVKAAADATARRTATQAGELLTRPGSAAIDAIVRRLLTAPPAREPTPLLSGGAGIAASQLPRLLGTFR